MSIKLAHVGAVVAGVIASSSFVQNAVAGPLFFDNFNSDTPGLNTTPAGWSLTQGSVDIIGGSFGFNYYPGNGYYIDLNGSTYQYGGIRPDQIFLPGTYLVTFNLGSSVGGEGGVDAGPTPKVTEVFLGNSTPVYISLPNLPPDWTYQSYYLTTTIPGSLVFDSLPDNPPNSPYAANVGNILDNVSVSQAPLPATWTAMLVGLAGLGFAAFRRQRQTSTIATV
jgi:MYXO-CTERM domain-containing protein